MVLVHTMQVLHTSIIMMELVSRQSQVVNGTDYFGSSVGASTSVTLRDGVHSPALVVGAYQDQSQGRVYVYDESGNQLVVIDPNPNSFGEYFGWSVAAGSERIVVGSPRMMIMERILVQYLLHQFIITMEHPLGNIH